MLGHNFYFSLIRKYVATFGTLFNDIKITREDLSGDVVGLINVPINYGPKEKMIMRYMGDPTLNRPYAVSLPAMSFEFKKLSYDGNRKLNTTGKVSRRNASSNNYVYSQYNPVPYNIEWVLQIYVKNAIDGTKIVEQILPFFTPDWTPTVELIPELNINMDIPIILKDVSVDDFYDAEYKDRRVLIWTLTFDMKAYFYGPVTKPGIIKFANVGFYTDTTANTTVSEYFTIQPGLNANGEPTTNINETIPYNDINVDDPYDIITIMKSIEDIE